VKRKRQFLEFALLSYLLAATYGTVFAQHCDPSLNPGRNWETQYRERGNRCEGVYSADVAAESIEVVSVTEGSLDYTLDKDAVIEVSCPAVADQQVHVRAVAIPPKVYYRMDAVIEPQQTLSWPLRDVVFPLKLLPSQIGVFGWLRETEIIYIPVLALMLGELTPAELPVQVSLRPSIDVEDLQWRYCEVKNGSRSDLTNWMSVDPSAYLAWKPIRIVLPPSATGKLYVEVAARDQKTGRWLKKTLRVMVRSTDGDEQENP